MKARTAGDAGTGLVRREAATADAHEIARLKRALARSEHELSQSLARQTATAEILQAISRSPTELQPVLDAVAQRAALLCRAQGSRVWLAEGDQLRAMTSYGPGYPQSVLETRPVRATSVGGRAFLERRCVHVEDVVPLLDTEYPDSRELQSRNGYRTVLVVPMLREGQAIGLISLLRNEVRPFAPSEISLVQTFADQAVIAIENVRLFNETRRALEHQTATAEVLKVISESPTDVQPVFDAICHRAMALSHANIGAVARFDGEWVHLVAFQGISPEADAAMRAAFPMRPSRASISARAVLEGVPVEIADVELDPDYQLKPQMRLAGYRSNLSVPMLRDGKAIGAITVCRPEPGTFPRPLVELLRTFADQAVIAIENVRLFNELQARNLEVSQALDQQTATSEILRVISSSPTDVQPVFDAIATAALVLCRARSASLLTYDGELLHLAARALVEPSAESATRDLFPRPAGTDTAAGRAVLTRRIAVIPDVFIDPEYAAREAARLTGARSFLGVPLLRDGHPVGAIAVGRPEPGAIPDQQVALLQTFADQAVIAIENVRLFNELREKGEQLELASRHKSQFLANMSHELRTPLNVIIGFTRIVVRRTQGQIEQKQAENLEKILASGQHLLALINTVLDLSKIEAGHVEVAATEVELASVLQQCVLTIEPLVKADTVSLVAELDGALPRMWVDEEKLRQIVINLLSNAAKFTASGNIRLSVDAAGESVRIAVTDTGIGIAADKLGLIFEEFEQADASSTRLHGGTGLGLAIARRLARLMGGDVEAESVPDRGSTFTITLPLRYRAPAAA
jgi:signal transduction histidine kinase